MTLRTQVLIWVGFTFVVILLTWLFRPILLPFAIGIALAYILNPVVTLVQRTGIGRAWSTTAVLLAVLGVIVGLFVVVTSWHRLGYPEGLFSHEEIAHGIHGGEIETSLMLWLKTETVRPDIGDGKSISTEMEREFSHLRAFRPAGFAWMTQDLNASGVVGNARAGTLEKGVAALNHGAKAFVELLEDVQRFDLRRLKEGPLKD